jgi:hypothetical protein
VLAFSLDCQQLAYVVNALFLTSMTVGGTEREGLSLLPCKIKETAYPSRVVSCLTLEVFDIGDDACMQSFVRL